MGLDMYLYRVSRPTSVINGDIITHRIAKSIKENVYFVSAEEPMPKTIQKNAIKCILAEESLWVEKVLRQVFEKYKIENSSQTAEAFTVRGSSYLDNYTTFKLEPCNDEAAKCLETLDGKEEILESGENTTTVKINKDFVEVSFEFTKEYTGKYIKINKIEAFAVVLKEVAYQRKGLTDEGWELLPENCQYCDDKKRIKEMTEVGGLANIFISRWVNGETVFLPWW